MKAKAAELAAAKADARLQDTAELLLAGAPPEGPEKAVRRSAHADAHCSARKLGCGRGRGTPPTAGRK